MANILRITDGTSILCDLNAFPCTLERPAFETCADGQSQASSCDLRVIGTVAQIQAWRRKLDQALLKADHWRDNRRGTRVFLEAQLDGTSAAFRTELVRGAHNLDPDRLKTYWRNSQTRVWFTFGFEHGPWQASGAAARTEINLAGAKGGVTIYDHDDAGHNDYVDVDGDEISGDLPALVELKLTNTYNDADQSHTFYVGVAREADLANFLHVLEGESAVGGTDVTLTPTANANCSGGNYAAISWTQVLGTEYELARWTYTGAQLKACKFGYFRFLARFKAQIHTDLYVRLSIRFAGSEIATGGRVLLSANVALQDVVGDVDVLQLPPWRTDPDGTPYPLTISLIGEGLTAAAYAIDLDCVFCLPTDSWRRLVPAGAGLPYTGAGTAYIVDNGILEIQPYENGLATTGDYAGYTGYGAQIRLWPGVDQRIYILCDSGAAGASMEIERTTLVQAWICERRKTPL